MEVITPKAMGMTAKTTYDPDTDLYFQWLCRKVGIPDKKQYLKLATELHMKSIFWPGNSIDTDKNRANDGLQLRIEFMDRYGVQGSSDNRGPCTMFEFIIGLAGRMAFIMGEEGNPLHTSYYFWKMIDNLRLTKLDDDRYDSLNGDFFVEDAVCRVLYRTYDADGRGGLFPLRHPEKDQRTVEIWYQMQSWLLESGDVEVE